MNTTSVDYPFVEELVAFEPVGEEEGAGNMPRNRETAVSASERRKIAADRTLYVTQALAVVLAGVILAGLACWAFLRRFAVFGVFVALVGCASPAEDYVRAEAAAWAQVDDKLDAWIDREPSYSAEKKDALHQLNDGRRARVSHAIAAIESRR